MASDTFTYSNGELNSVSGGLWVNDADSGSTLQVDTGQVKITTEDLQTAYVYAGAATSTAQYSECVNPVDGFTAGGPCVRTGGATGFSMYFFWPAFDRLIKYVNNSITLLGGGDLTPAYNATDVMRVEVTGSSVRYLVNGVEATGSPVTDSSIAAAGEGVGILMDEAASRLDTWQGGDLAPAVEKQSLYAARRRTVSR